MIQKISSFRLKTFNVVFFAGFLAMLGSNFAIADMEDDIRARISPAGEVCVVGERCASGLAVASAGSEGPRSPQVVYETFCIACHGTGANNSPVLGNVEEWEPRLAKGIDTLYENAINGFNENTMPARGLCMGCSDDDIKATVDYLLEAVQ